MAEASPQMEEYFKKINDEVLKIYEIANAAKAKGYDPDRKVAIPHAKNMAERVEGLISTVAPQIIGSGVTTRIAELEKQYGSQDWRVALQIALEVAQEKFCKFKNKLEAMEIGIRTGFSYVTVGVVSSPLEGFTQLKLKKRNDNRKEYFCLMYSGPIRSAGGTGASVSVIIADYIRKKMGYATYDPTEKEIKRAYRELSDYHERVTRLQYFPSEEETEFLVSHLPVQIDGDESEKYEVSNYKDLPRIETNRIRNGYCLMTAECLSLKAPKVLKQLSKWGADFGMDDWAFWDEFVKLQKEIKARGSGTTKEPEGAKIKPDWTYLKDLAAGRPVFAYPQREGGFRLRYGRSRSSGFSMNAIHPATMTISNDFLAFGTQLKMERPGKSTVLAACDTIDGPIVKLKNGSVKKLNDNEDAKKYNKQVEEIIYLGDMLICHGDFLNRNHILAPCAFNEEWWALYLEKNDTSTLSIKTERIKEIISKPYKSQVTLKEATEISEKLWIPLHPKYIFFWNAITYDQLERLHNELKQAAQQDGKLIIPTLSDQSKRSLELIGAEHTVVPNEHIIIEKDEAQALLANLGYLQKLPEKKETTLASVNALSKFKIKDKLGTFIGARMGRPEKAKARQMKGTPHALFPVGKEGGRLRSFQAALSKGKIKTDLPLYVCETCNTGTIYPICETCGSETKRKYHCRYCDKDTWENTCTEKREVTEKDGTRTMQEHGQCLAYKKQSMDICHYYNSALKKLNLPSPQLVKGIRGTSNEDHTPENLAKGIIRAKYGLNIFKEGTIRYDMTETVCTHFKPKEIGTPITKLKALGYTHDIEGKELSDNNQILELKAQDLVLPGNEGAKDEGADTFLVKVCNFLDELLVRFYGLPPYYNLKSKEDIIGHLTVAMSPHTASCMVSRIIGFSKTQGFMAHPLLHSILRRDCLSYETMLPIFDGKKWRIRKVGELVDELNPTKTVDPYGTKAIKVKGFKTIGFNREAGIMEEVPILDFTKHSKSEILKISLEDGKIIRVTTDHKFCVKHNNGIQEKRASDLKKREEILVPMRSMIPPKDIKELDLIQIFEGKDNVMVRGITDQIQRIIRGNRSQIRKKLNLTKSALDNYLLRDSYPITFIEKFLSQTNRDISLKNATISAKRDHVNLKPKIKLNEDVLWLIGLYTAEGYARKTNTKKNLFQVDIACKEKDIRERVLKTIGGNFGLKPSHITDERLVFSSRLFYTLLIEFLDCGRNAHEKKIPSLILGLPNKKLAYFLSGYFDGDGSVSKTDARVTCDSVSEELLSGLQMALTRFGIYTKRYYYKKKPGPKVREFYIRKGRPVPEFGITKLIITSNYITRFWQQIGFGLERKQCILKGLIKKTGLTGMKIRNDETFAFPRITEIKKDGKEKTYCLNARGHMILPNGILTKNCDGDEATVMMILDTLLNFSKKFLPNRRGSTQDAPLVLTSKLIPSEVDDMVFDMDIAWKYPLELYEAAEEYKKPSEVKVQKLGNCLGTEKQYEGMGFTHDTDDFNAGVKCSSYKILPTMQEKVQNQMNLAKKLRAVNEDDVAKLIIEKHFIKDIKGNLRHFSMQQFRCVDCNEKFRRPPLKGKCPACGGKIIFTISEGSVIKYLDPAIDLARAYNLPTYLRQSLELTKNRIESVFGRDPEKQEGLSKWAN